MAWRLVSEMRGSSLLNEVFSIRRDKFQKLHFILEVFTDRSNVLVLYLTLPRD